MPGCRSPAALCQDAYDFEARSRSRIEVSKRSSFRTSGPPNSSYTERRRSSISSLPTEIDDLSHQFVGTLRVDEPVVDRNVRQRVITGFAVGHRPRKEDESAELSRFSGGPPPQSTFSMFTSLMAARPLQPAVGRRSEP